MTTSTSLMTVGAIARETGQPTWLVRRVVDRLHAVTTRAGQYRIVDESRLPEIREALEAAAKATPAVEAEAAGASAR